jgi:hypothetical protein
MNNTYSNALPSSFRYKNVLEKGRPVHDKYDSFSLKHPAMDLSRRAKIFSPFDALRGFDDELVKTQADVTDTYLDDTIYIDEAP